jgi:hypothetical protein
MNFQNKHDLWIHPQGSSNESKEGASSHKIEQGMGQEEGNIDNNWPNFIEYGAIDCCASE